MEGNTKRAEGREVGLFMNTFTLIFDAVEVADNVKEIGNGGVTRSLSQ